MEPDNRGDALIVENTPQPGSQNTDYIIPFGFITGLANMLAGV
jgi:hypothetical protein